MIGIRTAVVVAHRGVHRTQRRGILNYLTNYPDRVSYQTTSTLVPTPLARVDPTGSVGDSEGIFKPDLIRWNSLLNFLSCLLRRHEWTPPPFSVLQCNEKTNPRRMQSNNLTS